MRAPRRPLRLVMVAALLGAIVALPSSARAQFGGRGGLGGAGRGGMGRRGGMGGRGEGMPGAARRTEPLVNSVDLILKHGTELALTDSQVVRLQRVKSHQDSAIEVVKLRLDSLPGRRGGAAEGGDPMAARDRMQARGEAMMAYRAVLKQGRDDAFGLLEKKQRKQAEKFESALKKEMQEAEPAGERDWGGRRAGADNPLSQRDLHVHS
ncbi:hypothetical protein [Gemmatirosa kalamazoonensis]|nr:hypothetical protein [Gemmatirosa kalamazoonensis]